MHIQAFPVRIFLKATAQFFLISGFIMGSLVAMDEMDVQEQALMRRMHQLSVSFQSKIRILPAHGRFKESQIDLSETDPLCHETYEELCKQAEDEGRDYVIAQYDVDKDGDEFEAFVDAYEFNRYLWKVDFFPYITRYEVPVCRKDFFNRIIIGPIHYFALRRLPDAQFYHVGSDYQLSKDSNSRHDLIRQFFRANFPYELHADEQFMLDRKDVDRAQFRQAERYELGNEYIFRKKFKEAIYWFRKAIDDNADKQISAEALLNISRCYFQQKKYEKTKNILLKRLPNYEDDPAIKFNFLKNISVACMHMDDAAQAKHWLLQMVPLDLSDSDKAILFHDLGHCCFYLEQKQEASKWGIKSAVLYLELADKKRQAGNVNEAKDLYLKAANQTSSSATLWATAKGKIAECCLELNQLDEAKKHCEEVLKQDKLYIANSEKARIHAVLAKIDILQGNVQASLQRLQGLGWLSFGTF